MPKGGLIRTAPKPLRDLDIGFYGAGFPNVAIECGIQQLNKLLMHYGCDSSAGTLLQSSVELLLLNLVGHTSPLMNPLTVTSPG